MSVVLVDAGGTNIGSVRYALQRLGADAELTSDADRIRSARHVILPGVGAAGPGMRMLREAGLVDVLRGLTQPVLGVCLGMQLLCERSDEGDTECLGVIPASVRHMAGGPGLRIPHMGWNGLRVTRSHPLVDGLRDDDSAYFVHSYAVPDGDYALATSDHGQPFAAVIASGNFMGMQFHPERSACVGAQLLQNFLSL
ncbi:imidazole glycerol phosphate synthase subunit HisH [Luteibacter sp. UNCMF366Tsu5.1]|uniref:imidazole glycerol phosphate synthase subunit HisH n=1 Tax=Luteibacter sp. UNCMF366Tsu5.1 TaxID=1502758 RepID=UPI00090860CE|nr:imidazole glycerol phosphate synthase subunit HisH [Luteibacter sp. UNCMF366Tsu5.1]SFW63196.1 glutamine amidotransferase [Luteibacter sp. UNCMF366Tsu5.1]